MDARSSEHDPPVADRIRRWGIVAWSIIGVLVLAATAVWALMQVQDIFPPLVLALVVIYILNPLVSRLQGVGVGRLVGSCLSYTVFFAIIAIALTFLVPVLVSQGQAFVRDFPETVERFADLADDAGRQIEDRFGVTLDVGQWLGGNQDLISEGLGRVGSFLRGAVHTVTLLVIGLILGFYLLIDLPRLRRSALRLVPPDRRAEAVQVAGSVGRAMGGFFRGQLLVALIVGVMSAVALRIIGLPYWLVVGMIAGFFNLIPLVGPYIGAIPGILIAGAFMSPISMLWVAIALTVVQQIDNHFISPNVMRWTVRLHPVTVMLSLIVGATLYGFWGMLVAVPIVASVKVVAAHVWRTRVPWGHEVFEDDEDTEGGLIGVAEPERREEPEPVPSAGEAPLVGDRRHEDRPL